LPELSACDAATIARETPRIVAGETCAKPALCAPGIARTPALETRPGKPAAFGTRPRKAKAMAFSVWRPEPATAAARPAMPLTPARRLGLRRGYNQQAGEHGNRARSSTPFRSCAHWILSRHERVSKPADMGWR
jgi:hypothetical protein